MRGCSLELELALTEKAVMGTVSSSLFTWSVAVFTALTPAYYTSGILLMAVDC